MTKKLYALIDFCKHVFFAYWRHATLFSLVGTIVWYMIWG